MSSPMICSYTFGSKGYRNRDYELGAHQTEGQGSLQTSKSKNCIYCGSELSKTLIESTKRDKGGWLAWSTEVLNLRRCATCGWWALSLDYERMSIDDQIVMRYRSIVGEAKHYSVGDLDVPISELRSFLAKHPSNVAHVHPTAFEHLVADCMEDSYGPAEVIHTGRSGDGGIDIKLILANNQSWLVQVKRRADLSKAESVTVVRELNGVLFREGVAKGMVVTTAHKFSNAAIAEAASTSVHQRNYEMHLLAFPDVVSMLQIPRQDPYEPWEGHLSEIKSHLVGDR